MLLWLVIAYLAVSIAIGLYGASKVHNAKDYVTAGRNLPFASGNRLVLRRSSHLWRLDLRR